MRARPNRRDDRPRTSDGGFVAVTFALLLFLIVVAIGFVVDVGNWNIHENRAQAAAEAAALGGAAFLPDDFTQAEATARQIAAHHGYPTGTVSVALGASNQLQVTIVDTVPTYFARILGIDSHTITRRSLAEFQDEVEMGSPTNALGNDPETGWDPDFWLSQASQGVNKDMGDRFATEFCSSAAVTYCAGTTNTEFSPAGYSYAVTVTNPAQPLRIQAFDPAFVWTGGTCNLPTFLTAANLTRLDRLDNGGTPGVPRNYYRDASTRYAAGNGDWCVGDDFPGTTLGSTTFTVRAPDTTTWDDTDNPVVAVCSPQTFGAYQPKSIYVPSTPSIFEMLHPSGGNGEWIVDPNDGVRTFAEVFRRWVTICEIPVGPALVGGDYLVQVQTPGGGIQNRFSLRVGAPSGSNGVTDTGQSTFARGALPIFANSPSADITFYLARIPPASSDRILEVTLWDIGDTTNPGSVQILPPSGVFSACAWSRNGIPLTQSSCQISGVHRTTGFDGTEVKAEVTIPSSFSCNWADPDDCWVTVRAQFSGGLTDFTTWTAQIQGEPVRLVE